MTESPFVRSGAVVRCAACDAKYRIKTSHFQREVHTGPKTLDETDTVLRSDSVDIEPDEISPVSIDDDGNVVGLSGLSELMRWSDEKSVGSAGEGLPAAQRSGRAAREMLKARLVGELDSAKPPPVAGRVTSPDSHAKRQARLEARRRKKNTQVLILVALACVLLGLTVVIILLKALLGASPGPDAVEEGQSPVKNPDPVVTPDSGVGEGPDTPVAGGASEAEPAVGAEPEFFKLPDKPVANPEPKFIVPWYVPNPDLPPPDAPAVLTPSSQVALEGWYVLNPPRDDTGEQGDTRVRLTGALQPLPDKEGQLLLTGSVRNDTDQALQTGELHVMLLDGSASVFAESFVPLLMIEPGGEQPIALPIAERYWRRVRAVRVASSISQWSDSMGKLSGVFVTPIGEGAASAVRVSHKNRGDDTLDGALILIDAKDEMGQPICEFIVEEQGLSIAPGQWLDLVIATPLKGAKPTANWSVRVHPR